MIHIAPYKLWHREKVFVDLTCCQC